MESLEHDDFGLVKSFGLNFYSTRVTVLECVSRNIYIDFGNNYEKMIQYCRW